MATFKLADLPRWVTQVQAVTDAVVGQATADLLVGIKRGPSITRGGRREPGTIPVNLGALRRSLQSSLYGSTTISHEGEDSYVLVAGSMKAGDVARFAWGSEEAPYARHVHDGANGIPGTHWVDHAENRWQATVDGAVAKVKAELG